MVEEVKVFDLHLALTMSSSQIKNVVLGGCQGGDQIEGGLRALKIHLLDWKCHYFPRGGRGLEVTTLSLCHFVTIGLRG